MTYVLTPYLIHEGHGLVNGTLEILHYTECSNIHGFGFGHIDYDASAIDEMLVKTNPPNGALSVLPALAEWARLYRTAVPSHHIWQKAVLLEPVKNISTGKWEQDYEVIALVGEELYNVNEQVAGAAKMMRHAIQLFGIEYEGAHANASNDDVAALSGCLHGMTSNKNETNLKWKGPNAPDRLPQWFTMTDMDIVENLYNIVFKRQQNAFRAEEYVTEKQRITPYDNFMDVADDMNAKFEELQNPVEV